MDGVLPKTWHALSSAITAEEKGKIGLAFVTLETLGKGRGRGL
jgi:hypothetical protein